MRIIKYKIKINIPTVFKEIKEGIEKKNGIENMNKGIRVKMARRK